MIIDFLAEQPIFTLFLIIAIGHIIGKIRIGSFSMGIAGALFAGLIISSLDPRLALPSIIYHIGLVLFVYTTGLSLGPTFFNGLKKTGLKDNLFMTGALIVGLVSTIVAAGILGLSTALSAGLYAGSFTVTPALASAMETLGDTSDPIVAFSIAYPISIIASFLAIGLFRKLWKIDQLESNRKDTTLYPRTVLYTRNKPCLVKDLPKAVGANIRVSRIHSDDDPLHLPRPDQKINKGDLVTVVATPGNFEKAVKWMGEKATEDDQIHTQLDHLRFRRIFVSNTEVVGKKIKSLKLYDKYRVLPTRVRRGDIDMVVSEDLVVEAGDRIRIVGALEDIKKAGKFLGDSYKQVSEPYTFSPALGMALGVAIGAITIPLPGGSAFALGAAGGTILVALILGAVRRTGKIVWQIPYSTNITIRHLGLLIFLAGIGSQAGGSMVAALSDPLSYKLMAAVAAISLVTVTSMILVGYKLLKIPFTRLSGMVAAMNTQPATLAYANSQSKTDDANAGFASVYPLALIGKIVLAQILIIILAS